MFIYVTSEESRDKLLEHGYVLIKKHQKQKIWVFLQKPDMQFDYSDVDAVLSNTLTF